MVVVVVVIVVVVVVVVGVHRSMSRPPHHKGVLFAFTLYYQDTYSEQRPDVQRIVLGDRNWFCDRIYLVREIDFVTDP